MTENAATKEQQALLRAIKSEAPAGLLHALMSAAERQTASELIDLGLVQKGRADLRRAPVAYFCADAK